MGAKVTLADCWRAAGDYAEADRCERAAARLDALRQDEARERARRMARVYAKHEARRKHIAAIRAERQAAAAERWHVWHEWYLNFDCQTCGGTGHNADVTAACPDCKYGRTRPCPLG